MVAEKLSRAETNGGANGGRKRTSQRRAQSTVLTMKMLREATEAASKKRKRQPSEKIAKERVQKRQQRLQSKKTAATVEKSFRAAGGYGRSVVSPWDLPPGGITKSPAWKLLVSRCGGQSKQPLPPEERDGAPVSGGFPIEKWAPNVLVDAFRCAWVPDDWGQGIKNTGPGGVYIGWISPEGKFYYHRKMMEKDLGRRLTYVDGYNAVERKMRRLYNPEMGKKFLSAILTPRERKHILKPSDFHFAVVSARRAGTPEGQHDIIWLESQLRVSGVRPRWYVDEASLEQYKALGLDAVVGGKLTPARNMALDYAQRTGKVCVQVSDDIHKWEYFDIDRIKYQGDVDFKRVNTAVKGAKRITLSPVTAAQFILAKMRSCPLQPKLGGVHPTANAAQAIGTEEFAYHHFVLGDFFVHDKSPCRFDETMTLKEDYDFTAAHLNQHGCVFRCNRLLMQVKHATNSGGAVSTRDSQGKKEQFNIAILLRKWPGVFHLNGRRKNEVVMRWSPGKVIAAEANSS